MSFGIERSKLVTVGLMLAAVALVLHAGDLEPWGPPGATMKPLSGIEPRQIIWGESLSPVEPLRITEPGSYYLGEDIDATGRWGIEIATSDVTIDLNGFALKNGFGTAIHTIPSSPTVTRTTVRNGTVSGWDSHGIDLSAFLGEYVVTDVVSAENGGVGIHVTTGKVLDCSARENGADGISAFALAIVKNCLTLGNGNNGIRAGYASIVSACVTEANGGNGIRLSNAGIAEGNSCSANQDAGILALMSENRIEGNHVTSNQYGIQLHDDGSNNVVVRNSASANLTQNYYVGSNNDVGPIGTAATATSPWANIQN